MPRLDDAKEMKTPMHPTTLLGLNEESKKSTTPYTKE